MYINYQQCTDRGDQCINQDYCVHKITKSWALFITADGLGGHRAGERMAKAFCEAMLALAADYVIELQAGNVKATLLNWFNQALKNLAINVAEDSAMQNAHTAFAMLWLDDKQTITVHIGDTRVYRVTENAMDRSRDHSVTQMLFDAGEIVEQEMGTHPDQNRLTRTVCLANLYRPSIKILPVADKNDCFILCTDGLWTQLTPQEIVEFSQRAVAEKGVKALVKTVIKRAKGESDNVTVQWLQIE